ncbi:hypothetical protein GXP70_03190 [Paenibacillus lycopersici]|uniref:Uncharacterized protein n=1 Tax=Paenibacillus lycopersici TaxID=2704462 RepID=A0A6C0FUC2_9BACL|nr:hypothetical protein [Paenibacillus lycopersici]QHT59061.1 hypothetical protein GXP70_03190 [Paenibacillus lycopersici]
MTIHLSVSQYREFERFFQYGNLKDAQYVFVGFEEGLGQETIEAVIQSRYDFEKDVSEAVYYLPEQLQPNQGDEGKLAYCITDMDAASRYTTRNSFTDYPHYRTKLPIDLTMSMQATLKLLLDNPSLLGQRISQQERRDCFFDTLHKPDSNTCMIDRYPLPKQGKFPYSVHGLFRNFQEYIAYNNRFDNYRLQILKGMYDAFPMQNTIVYAGIERGAFKLQKLYESIGFRFETKYTSDVHPGYKGSVAPVADKVKPFLLGTRGATGQKAILTPFFGMGQLGYHDLDVIATWILPAGK